MAAPCSSDIFMLLLSSSSRSNKRNRNLTVIMVLGTDHVYRMRQLNLLLSWHPSWDRILKLLLRDPNGNVYLRGVPSTAKFFYWFCIRAQPVYTTKEWKTCFTSKRGEVFFNIWIKSHLNQIYNSVNKHSSMKQKINLSNMQFLCASPLLSDILQFY